MKKIVWLDLDNTLWQTNAKWWIINKENPEKHLLRISQEEGYLFTSGKYLKDNHEINYNGIQAWLSNDVFNKIQKIKKLKNEQLGISFREFNDISFLEKQSENLVILINNVKHLNNHSSDTTIALLTARGNKKGHTVLLNKLKSSLKEHKININIDKIYFINDLETLRHDGNTPEKKCLIILEHIIGYKIENNMFIPLKQEKYDDISFYDDEEYNINAINIISNTLKNILNNTKTKSSYLVDEILSNFKNKKISIETNLVSTNLENPFITNKFNLEI